jgi:hypothetical protein
MITFSLSNVNILTQLRACGQIEHQVSLILHDNFDLRSMQFLTLDGSRRLTGTVKNWPPPKNSDGVFTCSFTENRNTSASFKPFLLSTLMHEVHCLLVFLT